jgi:hypothetical protein
VDLTSVYPAVLYSLRWMLIKKRPAKKRRAVKGFLAAKKLNVESPVLYLIATLPKERAYGTVLI